jgi:hypothetical protein
VTAEFNKKRQKKECKYGKTSTPGSGLIWPHIFTETTLLNKSERSPVGHLSQEMKKRFFQVTKANWKFWSGLQDVLAKKLCLVAVIHNDRAVIVVSDLTTYLDYRLKPHRIIMGDLDGKSKREYL